MTNITDKEMDEIPHHIIRAELVNWVIEDDAPREWDWKAYEENGDIFLETWFDDYRIDDLLSEKPNGVMQERRFDQKDYRDGCCSCTISWTYIALNNLVWHEATNDKISAMLNYGIDVWGKPEGRWRSTSMWTKVIVDYYNKHNPDAPVLYFHCNLIEWDSLHPVIHYALSKKYLIRFSVNTYLSYFRDRLDWLLTGTSFGQRQGGHSTNLALIDGEYWVVWSSYKEKYKLAWWEQQIIELVRNGTWRSFAYVIAPVKRVPQDPEKKESIKYMIDNWLTTQTEEQFLEDRDKPLTRWQLARILYRQSKL